MNIEKQVCTYEQGMRLKELGVVCPSYFMWYEDWRDKKISLVAYQVPGITHYGAEKRDPNCWAYSVAELGVMLPSAYDTMFNEADNGWRCYDNAGMDCPDMVLPTEAQCRANTIIHLLENNVITPTEVNERLK